MRCTRTTLATKGKPSLGVPRSCSLHKRSMLRSTSDDQPHQISLLSVATVPGWSTVEEALKLHSASARETLGWLKYALQHPDDASASAIGRMVSKEYGAHERAHTEQHRWRSGNHPTASPPSSPHAGIPSSSSGAAAPVSAASEPSAMMLWVTGLTATTATAYREVDDAVDAFTPRSSSCGPGFLRETARDAQRFQ